MDASNEYVSVESNKALKGSLHKNILNTPAMSSENSKSFHHFSTFLNSNLVYGNKINNSKLINHNIQGRLLTAYSKVREKRERLKSWKLSTRNKSEKTSVVSYEDLLKLTPDTNLH